MDVRQPLPLRLTHPSKRWSLLSSCPGPLLGAAERQDRFDRVTVDVTPSIPIPLRLCHILSPSF